MPIGKWGWRWFGPRLRSGSSKSRTAYGVVLVLAAVAYAAYGPLVFDAGYWLCGKMARLRSDRRVRVGLSVGVAVLYVAVLVAAGSSDQRGSTNRPRVVAAAEDTSVPVSPAPSATAELAATARPSSTTTMSTTLAPLPTPSATSTDPDADDDDPGATPGPSFDATATGIVPPSDAGSNEDRLPGEPDPALTPGALNPAVTQSTIGSTICVSGWTATIRPGEDYTNRLKVEQMAEYGYADDATADYEEDHLISLELGGAPADPRNLWPEPYTAALADGRPTGARTKDTFETQLKDEVCAGTITLAQAQSEIGDHWVHAYYGIALMAPTSAPSTPSPTPTPVPTSARTAAPTSSAKLTVTFTTLTSPIARNANATAAVQTAPNASCSIVVEYKSGPSKASGLGSKTANSAGAVSWTWKIGATTTVGSWPVTVTCTANGQTASSTKSIQVTT